jgi:hypothetical protein
MSALASTSSAARSFSAEEVASRILDLQSLITALSLKKDELLASTNIADRRACVAECSDILVSAMLLFLTFAPFYHSPLRPKSPR